MISLVLVAAVVVMAFAGPGTAHESKAAAHRRSDAHAATATLGSATLHTALSPIGLPLGKPALTLKGIDDPLENPVHPPFHEQPHAGILFNLDTGQVLWQHNAYTRLRIASLTKMMTALLTVTSAPPDAPVLITKEAVDMPGSKVGVLPLGKHVKLETLLYGLLLPSGNDAAVALAQHVAHTVNKFVTRMNAEAAKLGLGCTHYSSPSGYYDQYNFSCAADLALLAHDDLEAAAHRERRAHLLGGPAVPDQGRQAVPVQQQPAADLRLPGRHRDEDRRNRSRRPLPGGDRRAPRRAPRRGAAALARPRHAGRATCSTAASRTSITRRPSPRRRCHQGPESDSPFRGP